jgi:hypothetical protein
MAYRDLVLAKSPQLYWECQDSDSLSNLVTDSSGNNRPATRNGGAIQSPAAGYGQANSILLSGSTDFLYRVDQGLLNRSTICLEYVFRITAYPAVGHRVWISTWGQGPGGGAQNDKSVMLNADGTLTMYVYSNAGERLTVGSTAIGLGPHHIVMTVDADGSTLWVDGAIYIRQSAYNNSFDQYGSATLYFSNLPNPTTGSSANTDHGSFYVSDIALYAASLSPADISAHALSALTAGVLKGTALLSTGAAASLVLVRRWATYEHVAAVVPGADGKWSAPVAPGIYEVTARGPSGYQPITHGPVTTA